MSAPETSETTSTRDRRGLVRTAVATTDGGPGLDFISSVIAGLVIGLALDWVFDTSPVLTIIFVVLGFVSGFIKLWANSAILEQQAKERRRV